MSLLFPDSPNRLYYEGDNTFYARDYGAAVRDNNTTSPTLYFYSKTGTQQGYIWSASNHFYIRNQMDSGEFFIQGKNLSSNLTTLFHADPDGAAELYHLGSLAARTTDWTPGATPGTDGEYGIEAVSPDGNYTMTMTRNDGVSGTLAMKGYGDYIRIGGEDSGGGFACSMILLPHSYSEIRYNEVEAFEIDAEGVSVFDTSGAEPRIRLRGDDNDTLGRIRMVSGTDLYIQADENYSEIWLGAYHVDSNTYWVGLISQGPSFSPSPDDTLTCGKSTLVWSDIYASSGSVNTSDKRLKNILGPSLGLEFINRLKPLTYSWKKGARPHQGMTAQDVKEAMDELGIEDFAGYIDPFVKEFPEGEDNWKPKRNGEHKPRLSLRYSEFIAPLIMSVQTLKAELEKLKEKVPDGKRTYT